MKIKEQEIFRGNRKRKTFIFITILNECSYVYYGYTDWPSFGLFRVQ